VEVPFAGTDFTYALSPDGTQVAFAAAGGALAVHAADGSGPWTVLPREGGGVLRGVVGWTAERGLLVASTASDGRHVIRAEDRGGAFVAELDPALRALSSDPGGTAYFCSRVREEPWRAYLLVHVDGPSIPLTSFAARRFDPPEWGAR
jgi:hypothetical protein